MNQRQLLNSRNNPCNDMHRTGLTRGIPGAWTGSWEGLGRKDYVKWRRSSSSTKRGTGAVLVQAVEDHCHILYWKGTCRTPPQAKSRRVARNWPMMPSLMFQDSKEESQRCFQNTSYFHGSSVQQCSNTKPKDKRSHKDNLQSKHL
eukprot:2989532-Amphidinium_carterae.1